MKYLLILLIVGVFIAGCQKQQVQDGRYDELAKCLTEKGVVMYGTEWCPHCQNQKKLFGDSFQYATYVDCDKNAAACNAAGVEGYPTWVIGDARYPGTQNLYDLAQNSGCADKLA
jgi:glutaredoxin